LFTAIVAATIALICADVSVAPAGIEPVGCDVGVEDDVVVVGAVVVVVVVP
jgi:hypothetical protein